MVLPMYLCECKTKTGSSNRRFEKASAPFSISMIPWPSRNSAGYMLLSHAAPIWLAIYICEGGVRRIIPQDFLPRLLGTGNFAVHDKGSVNQAGACDRDAMAIRDIMTEFFG